MFEIPFDLRSERNEFLRQAWLIATASQQALAIANATRAPSRIIRGLASLQD